MGCRGRKRQRGREGGRERPDASDWETSDGSAGEILDLCLWRNVLLRQLRRKDGHVQDHLHDDVSVLRGSLPGAALLSNHRKPRKLVRIHYTLQNIKYIFYAK